MAKVVIAASTNVVAAGATAATAPGAQTVIQAPSSPLHEALLVVQIVVGVLSAIYISLKLVKAVREKKPLAGSPTS